MMRRALGPSILSALFLCACVDDPFFTEGQGGQGGEGAHGGQGGQGGQGGAGGEGGQVGEGGPTLSTSAELGAKRYVAAGDRAYVIGSEDGAFPPMGWHIRGEMGGVWIHPIKLLDGYWFSVDGAWLPPASRFTAGAGYVELELPEVSGLKIARTEFSPDGSPVVLVRLTLHNTTDAAKDVALKMAVRSELMASYGWGWTMPSAKDLNGKDQGAFDAATGRLSFEEPPKAWRATIGAAPAPASGVVGDTYWGPVPAAAQPDYLENGNGTGGELTWQIKADAGATQTLWIAIAGSHSSKDEAEKALGDALSDPDALLKAKVAGRLAVLAQTEIDVPDATLKAAFDWGKLNMADLRRTVTDVEVRDVAEGKDYPMPVTTLPSITGIGAGYPDYPWLFGTDGAYTSYPLVAAGQWDTAMQHLRSIRDVSLALNQATGKVVHEVVTDGSVYFGTNASPGNTNETAQFAVAVDLLWRWSGDQAFLDEMYDFVSAGMAYVATTLDADADGWPEGYGMVERGGMGSEKLDVTSYTWDALGALERMATAKGDMATAEWAKQEADTMKAAFEAAFWMPTINRYADSLCNAGDEVPQPEKMMKGWTNVCDMPNQMLQQHHWINATPMEVSLAEEAHAAAALDQLETLSGPCGLYHTGFQGGPDEKGELKCWTLPTSVMAVAEASYGRVREGQALYYVDSIAKLLNLEMPGALPEIAPSPGYNPFVDFRERAMFMQAWSSYGIQWLVVRYFLGVSPHVPDQKLSVVPHVPSPWPGLKVKNLRVGSGTMSASASREADTYTTVVSAPAGLMLTIGHVLPAGATIKSATLDGAPVDPVVVTTLRGVEAHVEAMTGTEHTLVVVIDGP